MKLTVLGNCGPMALPGKADSSYLLEEDGHYLLLDAGTASTPHLLAHIGLDQLDAVVLSHLHFDHCSDALTMQYSLKANPKRLICPDEPANVLGDLLSFGGFVHENAAPGAVCDVGPFHITFGKAKHPVPCVSIRVECAGKTFVYTGDSNDCPEQIDFIRGADLLLADSGMTEADWSPASPHRTAKMCGELAAKAGAHRLMLSHFGPKQNPEEEIENASQTFDGEILAAQVDVVTEL